MFAAMIVACFTVFSVYDTVYSYFVICFECRAAARAVEVSGRFATIPAGGRTATVVRLPAGLVRGIRASWLM